MNTRGALVLALMLAVSPGRVRADEGSAWDAAQPSVMAAATAVVVWSVGMAWALVLGAAVRGLNPVKPPRGLVPSESSGDVGRASQLVAGALVGGAVALPLVTALAVAVDGIAWHVLTSRKVAVRVPWHSMAYALGLVGTLPAVIATGVLMASLAVATRWEIDKLQNDTPRLVLFALLGNALAVVFLLPLALGAATVIRAAMLVVLGPPPES